jgi:lipopolysaccharide/colanic/teichoic acid biosynthesis glycosyltransferase
MTGLWQIRGRGEQSYGKLVQLDRDYVRNWSLLMDLRILMKTIPAVVRGKGAY